MLALVLILVMISATHAAGQSSLPIPPLPCLLPV